MVASLQTMRNDTTPRQQAMPRVTHGLAVHLAAPHPSSQDKGVGHQMEALMKQQSCLPLHKRSKGLNKHQASQVFLQQQRNLVHLQASRQESSPVHTPGLLHA